MYFSQQSLTLFNENETSILFNWWFKQNQTRVHNSSTSMSLGTQIFSFYEFTVTWNHQKGFFWWTRLTNLSQLYSWLMNLTIWFYVKSHLVPYKGNPLRDDACQLHPRLVYGLGPLPPPLLTSYHTFNIYTKTSCRFIVLKFSIKFMIVNRKKVVIENS